MQLDPLRVIGEHHGLPVERTPHGVGGTNWPRSVADGVTAVVAALRAGDAPPVKMEEALLLQQIVDALYRSATLEREVALGAEPAVE